MSWAYTRSQRMRPFTWAQEITTATQGAIQSKITPRIMVPPYRLNPDADLNQGLVAKYISLPGTTGGRLWYDLCGKNNVTLTNMTTGYGWQGSQGRPGGWGAMRFDGSNDVVTTASTIASGAEPFSVMLWMRQETAQNGLLIGRGAWGTNTAWSIYSGSGGILVAGLFYDNSSRFINPSFAGTNNGKWNHIGMIFSGGNTLALYWNGIQKASSTNASFSLATPATSSTIAIGSNSVGTFSGYIDDISIYNRALSSTEVKELYEASKNQYRDEILCAYEI